MDNQNGQFSSQDQNKSVYVENENYYQDNLNNDQQYQYQPNVDYQSYQNEAPKSTSTAAVFSLICGILAIILGCCCWIGLIPGIVGIILSVLSKKNNEKSGIATAGLICSIIGAAFGAIGLIFSFVAAKAISSDPDLSNSLREILETLQSQSM